MDFALDQIKEMIYLIRGQKVMFDSDLAKLYKVDTKTLNRQVRRNWIRFPIDFLFQLTPEEFENLRCQNGTSSASYGGRRYQPLVFTENGVAMLSGILNSERAILINISIMRTFTKLRSFSMLEKEIANIVDNPESNTSKIFKNVFKRLDNLEENMPSLPAERNKIGIKGSLKGSS